MKIIGIVGWKNNGKTTLIEGLVTHFAAMGLSVSTIKHAHHDFDIDHPGKDSYRHRQAGAEQVIVASKARWALVHELRGAEEPSLEELLAQLKPVDLVIVEGFKQHNHPKIDVVLDETATPIHANGDPSIIAAACKNPYLRVQVPILPLDEPALVADFIIEHLHMSPAYA